MRAKGVITAVAEVTARAKVLGELERKERRGIPFWSAHFGVNFLGKVFANDVKEES